MTETTSGNGKLDRRKRMTHESRSLDLDIRAVVLVGARDFGRCPLAARVPAALWPVGDQPSLVRVLDHLAGEGIDHVSVCCGEDIAVEVEAACRGGRPTVTIVVETITSGTGGCLRDAASSDPGDLIVVLSGSMMAPPMLGDLVDAHRSGGADMSVVFNPGCSDETAPGPAAEIFLCEPKVLECIPAGGYSDIKEGVIPAIVRAGGTVRPLVLARPVGNFHDRRGYLDALDTLFRSGGFVGLAGGACEETPGGPISRGDGVFTHPSARICGPVLMGDRARVLEGAVVVGPAMLGADATVGENSAMIRSVLWAGAEAGTSCEIRESVVDCRVAVPEGTKVIEQGLTARALGQSDESEQASRTREALARIVRPAGRCLDRVVRRLAEWTQLPPNQVAALMSAAVVLAALLWSYWPTVLDLVGVWKRSDEYSSGMLVPLLSVYVIWLRREDLASIRIRPALFSGTAAFLFAQAARAGGMFFMYQFAERLSLVLSIVAVVLLITGWRFLARLTPVLLFLCLMLPWPNRIQAALALPLQRWATGSAVFCLELAGWDVVRDGNVIHIGSATVAVAEACNGLRMITAFFVISGLVVLLAKRAWWEKLIVLLSSLPIALLCNTLRLAVTAVFFTIIKGEIWEQRFHDWGGYAMMPLALAMVVGELWLLSRLTTPPTRVEPAIISRRHPQHVPDP